MEKSDPDFEWKMPIDFYGKVIDQFGDPVSQAEVEAGWTTVVGPVPDPKTNFFTDRNGSFAIAGIQGKRLSIGISKTGYQYTSNSTGSFEYAAFYDNLFHIPDPNHPVIFRLHKLVDAEPLYVFSPYGEIDVGGGPLILDATKGKIGSDGNLSFSIVLGAGTNQYGSDFTLSVTALNGSGLVTSEEEFLTKAPQSGYQKTLTVTHKVNDPDYRPEQTLRFYVKTRDNTYAAMGVKVSLRRDQKRADFEAGIYYNPSGSPNLEFDQNKWINR